ncbi:DNA polymerase eta [Carabus blaptoides fortunei]
MTSHTERVIVLVDMDCFYCQVEEKLNPELIGKPIAVVQYNAWRGGGIIAVNYPARDRGVTRHMRGNEAKEKCPEIELVRVPNVRGKADLTKYREAGKRVAEVLRTFTPLLQRASVDEAYLDITEAVNSKISSMTDKLSLDLLPNTHVVGCETRHFVHNVYNSYSEDCNLKLAIGGVIVEEIRAAVYDKTGYRCSAGIAHNKILAKLACGLHKPNKQTILPQDGVPELYQNLPLKKIRSLGGKFGNSLSTELNITNMGELGRFSEQELIRKYDEKTASWLYNIARGIDNEPVEVRLVSKSIGCCKKFPGRTALKTMADVNHWLSELSTEIAERLEQDQEENNRRAKQLVISFAQEIDRKDVHGSKTSTLNSYEATRIATDAYEVLRKLTQRPDGCFKLKFLGLSAGKFEECKKGAVHLVKRNKI